ADALWKQTLWSGRRIESIWELVVRDEISIYGARVECAACVASRLRSDTIDFVTLCCREVATRAACWDGLSGEWAQADAQPTQLGDARFRLPRLRIVGVDQTFDGFVRAWPRSPARIELESAGDRVVCPGLRCSQAGCLSEFDL